MENNVIVEKEKVGKGVIVLMIILTLILLSLAGYIVYDKFIAKEETPKTNKLEDKKELEEINNARKERQEQKDQANEEETVKKLFIEGYLENPESEKLVEYRVDKIQVLKDAQKDEIVKMGYKDTDTLAFVTYSVKVNDINTSKWNAGNGEGAADNWIVNKMAAVVIRDGKLESVGTGF